MKALIRTLVAVMLVFSLTLSISFAKEKKELKIKTSAYSWMCKNKIETKLNKMDGIDDCELDLATKTLTIKFDEAKITQDKIVTEIKDLGYEAIIKPVKENPLNTEQEEKQK